eukprot:gene526-1939_t
MAQDGSYEVAWKGNAFPYLMNHPNNFMKTENYGSARQAAKEESAPAAQSSARTGTWDGPAPKGYLGGAKPEAVQPPPVATGTVAQYEDDFTRINTGAKMPLIGLDCDTVSSADVVKQALANGCYYFDCSEKSGTEAIVGEGLKEAIISRRDGLFISSKAWNSHHKPADLRAACEGSIAKVGVSYLDLYMLHWPEAWTADIKDDSESPSVDASASIQETWGAMEKLVDDGLVKSIGLCNFGLKQVEDLLAFCRIKPVVNLLELHPGFSQRKIVGVCYRKGIQCVSHSPLVCAEKLALAPLLQRVSKEAEKTIEQVLVKYNLQRGVPILLPESAVLNKDLVGGVMGWRFTNIHKITIDDLENGQRCLCPAWKTFADAEEGGIPKPSLVL